MNSFCTENLKTIISSSHIGYTCSYTPEELILAAGFIPYRMMGSANSSGCSESFLPPNFCPYIHRLFNCAYERHFDNLYGLVFADSCDPMRRLADIWSLYLKPVFFHRLDVPRRKDNLAEDYFLHQLQKFKQVLESWTGRLIKQSDLQQAISTLNRTRELMIRLDKLRSLNSPAVSGREYLRIAQLAAKSDKGTFNSELEKYLSSLERISGTGNFGSSGVRILLTGCMVENEDFLEMIESRDAFVVADTLCNGSRHFQDKIDPSLPPLEAITRRYLRRASCSRMQGIKQRLQHADNLINIHQCQGVICHTLKFCDLVQSDVPGIQNLCREKKVPFLQIEREKLSGDFGQIKTRIEAFLEMIRNPGSSQTI